MQDFHDAVSDVVAGAGLGVSGASQAVVPILVDGGSTFKELIRGYGKYLKSELALETDRKRFTFHSAAFVQTGHSHECQRRVFVEHSWEVRLDVLGGYRVMEEPCLKVILEVKLSDVF